MNSLTAAAVVSLVVVAATNAPAAFAVPLRSAAPSHPNAHHPHRPGPGRGTPPGARPFHLRGYDEIVRRGELQAVPSTELSAPSEVETGGGNSAGATSLGSLTGGAATAPQADPPLRGSAATSTLGAVAATETPRGRTGNTPPLPYTAELLELIELSEDGNRQIAIDTPVSRRITALGPHLDSVNWLPKAVTDLATAETGRAGQPLAPLSLSLLQSGAGTAPGAGALLPATTNKSTAFPSALTPDSVSKPAVGGTLPPDTPDDPAITPNKKARNFGRDVIHERDLEVVDRSYEYERDMGLLD